MDDELRSAKYEGYSDEEKASMQFAYDLLRARTITDVNLAAGAFLQAIGMEPSDG